MPWFSSPGGPSVASQHAWIDGASITLKTISLASSEVTKVKL